MADCSERVARGSITIVAALSREKMQNCRPRARSRGRIKSGVVIYRNSCGQSRARGLSPRNICRKLPPRHRAKAKARARARAPNAARRELVWQSRLRVPNAYFKAAFISRLPLLKMQSIQTAFTLTETFIRDLSRFNDNNSLTKSIEGIIRDALAFLEYILAYSRCNFRNES